MWLFILLLLISVTAEGTFAFFPLTLSILIVLALLRNDSYVFLLAALSGIILDILLLRPIGVTSFIYVLLLFLLFLYDRKYEIQSFQFVFFASLLTSGIYLTIFRSGHLLIESFLTAGCSSLIFIILKRLTLIQKKLHA